MKKKVGLITMHRVLNYGSALQAYALQKKIIDFGFDCEIIDYIFPNVEHLLYQNPDGLKTQNSFCSYLLPLLAYIKRELTGLNKSIARKQRLFEEFYEKNLVLSSNKYSTRLVLEKDPPVYDLYVTGSDQVWNSKYIGYDTSFMFSFVKDLKPRISYAASFSSDNIPDIYRLSYQKELRKYSKISVREEKGISLVHDLVSDKEVEVVCDPTLLLNKEEWKELVVKSNINLKGKYMLVYILDYAYNPYPNIYDRIEEINKELHLPIVLLSGRRKHSLKHSKLVAECGPYEFLSLFMNASYIVTTSFHGTAFALNFNKPFCAIIQDYSGKDSRIYDLLEKVGKKDNAILYNVPIKDVRKIVKEKSNDISLLENYRKKSIDYLFNTLMSFENINNNSNI